MVIVKLLVADIAFCRPVAAAAAAADDDEEIS
jgi:hypothetical protein